MRRVMGMVLAVFIALAAAGCTSGMKDDGMMKNDSMTKNDAMMKKDAMKK